LLTPLAIPANRSGAAASTVAVSGATVSVRPTPCSTEPGRISTAYGALPSTRTSQAVPAAMISGPAVMGRRGPMRWARAPARAENRVSSALIGSIAAPAAVAP
jgi:hypothetical protein